MMTVRGLKDHLATVRDDALVLVESVPGSVVLLPIVVSHETPVLKTPSRHIATYRRAHGGQPALVLTPSPE